MPDCTIHLIGGNDDEAGLVSYGPVAGLCRVSLNYRDYSIEASSSDYFEAFSQIRLILEQEGLIPFCYGSSLNVFPPGMCRDMGSGLTDYRLVAGRAPERTDLVKIFESGHDVIPASVANQKAFYSDWIQSRNDYRYS